MEKLLKDCDLNCAEDKQILVLEKCLQLVHSDREERSKSLGWLLLARVMEKCSSQCLRTAQSRMAKKLIDVCKKPSLEGGIFLRQMLVRNPQVGSLHAETIDMIICSLIDQSLLSGEDTMRRLSIELFALRYGSSKSDKVLATLSILLTSQFITDDRSGLLDLKTLGISSVRSDLISFLFELFSYSLQFCGTDESLNIADVMGVVEYGLKHPEAQDGALAAILSIATNSRFALLPHVVDIVSMLVSLLEHPSVALFSTLGQLSIIYRSSSSLYRHLYMIFSSLKHPLDDQTYGREAAVLISSIVESSFYLVKPEVLLSVQRLVCDQSIRWPHSPVYRQMLAAFLSSTHELVPVPIQVARTVLSRSDEDEYSNGLRALCDIVARPRIQNLAQTEISKRCIKATPKENSDEQVATNQSAEPTQSASDWPVIEDRFNELTDVKSKEEQHQPTLIPSIVEKVDQQKLNEKKVIPVPKVVSTVSTVSSPPVPKKKKKKHSSVLSTTILQEGEASVDDILNSFCPE